MAEIDTTPTPSNDGSVTGRSVFLVETTAAGIAIQTALLSNDGRLLQAPAVFPDVEYAFAQIEELRRLVSRHFSEAARLGAQLVAAQQQQNQPSITPETPDVSSSSVQASTQADAGTKTRASARSATKK
jgi:hypothetical protein